MPQGTQENETQKDHEVMLATGQENLIIMAAEQKKITNLAKVDGIAYGGGEVSQWWCPYPIVIDLAGMKISPQVPLLYNHMNEPDCRLGKVDPVIHENMLNVTGGIDSETERGKKIVDAGKKIEWQLSVGARILKITLIDKDEKVTVNGREFVGPIYIVKESKLREVSVVAVGADEETHLHIAASLHINANTTTLNKGVTMNEALRKFIQAKYSLGSCDDAAIQAHLAEIGSTVDLEMTDMGNKALVNAGLVTPSAQNKPDDTSKVNAAEPVHVNAPAIPQADLQAAADNAVREARKIELKRIEDIKSIAASYPDIQERAINAGWTKEYTQEVVNGVKSIAAGLSNGGMNIVVKSGKGVDVQALEASMSLRLGIPEADILASCGEQALELGSQIIGLSLRDVCREVCRIEGKSVSLGFNNETIRAAFSTVALPGILSNVANKIAMRSYTMQTVIAKRLCTKGNLRDFKESERYRMTDVGDLELVTPGGEIKDSSLMEEKATNKLDTYGKKFTLTRQMIYNDDMGEFVKIPRFMGSRAARLVDQLFFERLLRNPDSIGGKPLFCAGHKNYMTGDNSALGVESLEKAITAFLDQTDADGQPISIEPKYLLVPSILRPTADRLTKSAYMVGGTQAIPNVNVLSNYGLEVASSSYLNNASYAGHSATGWYLFGDPNQVDTFEIGYLEGRETPTVERGEVDFDTLGISFRVFFDVGVREQDYRGMFFATGKK